MKMTYRALALLLLLSASAAVQAQWSANVGYASEYHFRGIFQAKSSASAGLDYENGGFYAGTWAADVDDGLEVDGYFGFGGESGEFSYSVGYTGYFYTGDFDDTYQEINLGAGFGNFGLDVAVGEYDNFSGPTQDYIYYALSFEHEGFSAVLGGFSEDFDGEYLELGYGSTIAEFDWGVSLILANDDLIGEDDETLLFTLGKSFDL